MCWAGNSSQLIPRPRRLIRGRADEPPEILKLSVRSPSRRGWGRLFLPLWRLKSLSPGPPTAVEREGLPRKQGWRTRALPALGLLGVTPPKEALLLDLPVRATVKFLSSPL